MLLALLILAATDAAFSLLLYGLFSKLDANNRLLRNEYVDALRLLSERAQKAEKLASDLALSLDSLQNDRSALLESARAATMVKDELEFSRNRILTLEQTVIGLADARLQAQLRRDPKDTPPDNFPGPTRNFPRAPIQMVDPALRSDTVASLKRVEG